MLISKQTSEALIEVYGVFFDLNATLDVASSIMMNKWTMPQASDIVHHRLSHLMPLLADQISEIQDNYNIVTYRPEVHRDFRDYDNLKDMFETILTEFADAYNMIKMCNKIADEQGDFNVHGDLVNFIKKFNIVIGQIITLRDKSLLLPDDYITFDRQINTWGIVGLPELIPIEEEDDER